MSDDTPAFHELCYYTLAHGDPSFIHQHVVDAYAAQTVDEHDKPIKLAFALAGLYLHLEKGYTGRQVQLAHMKMARRKSAWPTFSLPRDRGKITVREVLLTPPGSERDEMILQWCASVWATYRGDWPLVVELLAAHKVC